MSKITIPNDKEFVELFLDEYLTDGMGAMPKREFDILAMNLVLNYGGLEDKNNQELSIFLQTPESIIKRPRYETRLKYPPNKDYVKREFLCVLSKSVFELNKKDETVIDKMKKIFVMEDDYLRHEIQGRLKEKEMFAATSFNQESVKVDCSSLVAVIGELYDQETAQHFREGFNSLHDSKEKALTQIFIEAILKSVVDTAVKIFSDIAVNVIKPRCELV